MFVIKDGMQLKKGDRVEVYYNLHKGGFSIKSLEKGECKGKVVAYSSTVLMSNAKFSVSASGVKKVREEKRKRVCAVVRGIYEGTEGFIEGETIYFNPYTTNSFIKSSDGQEITSASSVYFYDKTCVAKRKER